ncbi:MAG: radical SAM protein [Candidatus Omnitrophota bacterium]|nr:radical SAM protein [Candidatus Omnitrophota bacterium]
MRVLLVKPYNLSDHIQPSLGLGYLATALRQDHDVRIVDCIKEKIDAGKLEKIIRRDRPDVLGMQCYTFDLRFVREALKAAKAANKGIVTMLGGPHPSAMPGHLMDMLHENLDFSFLGEAELSLPRLLAEIDSGAREFLSVPGLAWRDGPRVVCNPKIMTEDLDSLGIPAWDMIHPEEYPEAQHGAFFKQFPIAPIMVTRGCPYSCTFCAGSVVSGKKIRRRTADSVLNEIAYLKEEFGIREFHVIDDNFTFDASYAKDFLRKLKKMNLGMSWAVPNGIRMDTIDREMLSLMKETGLYLISLGIESGSDAVLRSMRKCITKSRIRECVRMINDAGIDIAGFFILGFPGETIDTIKETIKFSIELKLVRANFFTYLPFPGSDSYGELEKNDELKGVDWDNFYFTADSYIPKGFTRKAIRRFQRMAFARFYLRPRILFYNIKSIKSLRHFLFLLKRFMRWIVKS